jgi:hypothetical protein
VSSIQSELDCAGSPSEFSDSAPELQAHATYRFLVNEASDALPAPHFGKRRVSDEQAGLDHGLEGLRDGRHW